VYEVPPVSGVAEPCPLPPLSDVSTPAQAKAIIKSTAKPKVARDFREAIGPLILRLIEVDVAKTKRRIIGHPVLSLFVLSFPPSISGMK
jgi:hypothetical protein